jgi:hypothetical protein
LLFPAMKPIEQTKTSETTNIQKEGEESEEKDKP